jgi:hypothetical protein
MLRKSSCMPVERREMPWHALRLCERRVKCNRTTPFEAVNPRGGMVGRNKLKRATQRLRACHPVVVLLAFIEGAVPWQTKGVPAEPQN